jgi:hypothetical protein
MTTGVAMLVLLRLLRLHIPILPAIHQMIPTVLA